MRYKKRKSLAAKLNRMGWLFILPAAAFMIVYLIYPFFRSVLLSLQTKQGFGIGNYLRLFQDQRMINTFKVNFYVIIVNLCMMLPIAFITASVLEQKCVKHKGIYRLLLFVPCSMTFVSCSTVFKLLFRTDGLVNVVLTGLGIFEEPINFLATKGGAYLVIAIVMIWRWSGYNMVIYCSYMSNIDTTVYEAAAIDGATGIKKFFHITIPLLKPAIVLTMITSLNGSMQALDEIYTLTDGGPGTATLTIAMHLYNTAFRSSTNFGYASAMGVMLTFIIILITQIQKKAGDRE